MPIRNVSVFVALMVVFGLTGAAAQTKQFENQYHAVVEYAANGAQAGVGSMQTWADGRIDLFFDYHQQGFLAGQALRGTYTVSGGRFCYRVRISGQMAENCARVAGDYLNFPSGVRVWMQPVSPRLARGLAQRQFGAYAGDAVTVSASPAPAPAASGPAPARLSRDDLLRIQTQLQRLGYDPGRPDGVMGRKTRAAIDAWRRKTGAAATGDLTSAEAKALLRDAPTLAEIPAKSAKSGRAACANPMSAPQIRQVAAAFERLAPTGDGFRIGACRTITLTVYGGQDSGPLHELAAEVNSSHHDTVYLGLLAPGGHYIKHKYIADQNNTKAQSARKIAEWNKGIVRMLGLAGYDSDPNQRKRAEMIERDMDNLQRPDFGESLGALLSTLRSTGGGGSAASGASGAQGGAAASSGARTATSRAYRCDVRCPIKNAADGKVTLRDVQAESPGRAETLLQRQGLTRICIGAGFPDPNQLLSSPGVYCRP